VTPRSPLTFVPNPAERRAHARAPRRLSDGCALVGILVVVAVLVVAFRIAGGAR